MTFRDVRELNPAERWRAADYAKSLAQTGDVILPRLEHWNYDPCPAHQQVQPDCRKCGVLLRRHQRTAIAWFYYAMKGLLGDPTGTGKTAIVAGVLALCAQTGELGARAPGRRAVVIAGAVFQWRDELRRMVPSLRVVTATGTPQRRLAKYTDPWDVLIISPETLRLRHIRRDGATVRAGDLDVLQEFDVGFIVADDVDPLRHENATSYAVRRMCERATRVITAHATPLQKRVDELYDFLVPVGGLEMFGPKSLFRHRFVRTESVYVDTRDQFGHLRSREVRKDVGVNDGAALKRMLYPLVMRRTLDQIDDVEMPELVTGTIWLDPTAEQRRRYAELRTGVLRKIRQDGIESVTRPAAMAQWMHGWQICSGLTAIDGNSLAGSSAKLDWVTRQVTGDFEEDKVIAFVHFKPNVTDLSARLTAAGVGHVLYWGNESSKQVRHERLARFWDDPSCQVIIGTTSLARSLNLQVARHLVAVDTVMNPAVMTQLVGRARRSGSRHRTVYFHQLLLRGTQEVYIPEVLRREQGLADYVWNESSDVFEALTPQQLAAMVSGDPQLLAAAGIPA